LFPTTVFPTAAVPLFTVAHSLTVVLSPNSAVDSSPRNFRSLRDPGYYGRRKDSAIPAILAPSSIVEFGPIQVPSPITTLPDIYAKGSITTSLPINCFRMYKS